MGKNKDKDDRGPSMHGRYDAYQALQRVFESLRAQPASKDGIALFPRGIDSFRARLMIDGVVELELELAGPPAKPEAAPRQALGQEHALLACPPGSALVPSLINMAVWQARALAKFAGNWTLTDCAHQPIPASQDGWFVRRLCTWSPEPNTCYVTGGDIGVEVEAPVD
jgi:hypothetical protein